VNIAADKVILTPGQLGKLDSLPVAADDHHNEAQAALLER
jgi:hypothetical protein